MNLLDRNTDLFKLQCTYKPACPLSTGLRTKSNKWILNSMFDPSELLYLKQDAYVSCGVANLQSLFEITDVESEQNKKKQGNIVCAEGPTSKLDRKTNPEMFLTKRHELTD